LPVQAQVKTFHKFALGFNVGLNTMNGLGPVVAYRPDKIVEFNLGGGVSLYNGGKIGVGGKVMFQREGYCIPFFSVYYSVTTGKHLVSNRFSNEIENYTTFPNQYFIPNLGLFVPGNFINHYLSVGYTVILNKYRIDRDPHNSPGGEYSYDTIVARLKGGFMITYTMTLYLHKSKDLD